VLVTLSSDQAALRETTAKFLDDIMPLETVRGLRDDPVGFPPTFWRRGAELGWTSLLVDEEHGGGTVSGFALQDLSLIAYEFGAHAAPGPLLPVNIVAAALSSAGSPAQREVLGDLMAGTATAAWCNGAGSLAGGRATGSAAAAVTIRRDGDELVLTGVVRPVENAQQAEHLLVTAELDGGLSQLLVPAATAGIAVEPMHSVDLTRRFAVVRFDDVRVPVDSAVGVLGGADDQVHRQVHIAMAIGCAESVGAMQRAFEMTRTWVADRYSFGRSLDSYQEIKHRFADLLCWLESAHAITDVAIAALDHDAPDAAELVGAAKAYTGEYGAELAQDCVQLHGGIGLTFEHDLHLFLRRVTLNRTLFGTPVEHRRRIGAQLAAAVTA
jgi:alkylation response protein AidB-like acyl-CoA dehydrogenase